MVARTHITRRPLSVALMLLVAVALTGSASGQSPADSSVGYQPTGEAARLGYGAQVLLTNSGFGLGGYAKHRVAANVDFIVDASLSAVRDEREVAFFDRFGRKDVPNKANYLLVLPVRAGFQRRLFRSRIEDNFRPFFHVSGGPSIGWKYPYFDDENENGRLDQDEPTYLAISGVSRGSAELGFGGSIALGADFGPTTGTSYGVRIGYRFTRFNNPIELISSTIKPPDQFIGSPVLMVYFGSLKR